MRLRPRETQVFAGNEVARQKAEGIEFADLRPFAYGDRMRRINWRASARRGELWVNEHHTERNTDVVLFLDTFVEARRLDASTLDGAVRAAASLSSEYLRQRDRVGLVSFGGLLRWFLPGSGLIQRYRIIDALLDTEVIENYAWKDIDVIPRADTAAAGARRGADAAARSARRERAARPALARLRPRGRRGLAGAVRDGRPGRRAGRARAPALADEPRVAPGAIPSCGRVGDRMDGGRAARGRARGGGVIQALRAARTRLALAACGGAVALALGAYAAAFAEQGGLLLALVGLVGAALACAGALAGLTPVLVGGLGMLVVEYAVAAGEQDGAQLDTRAAVWGVGLLLAAELLFLAAELSDVVAEGGDLAARRLGTTSAS